MARGSPGCLYCAAGQNETQHAEVALAGTQIGGLERVASLRLDLGRLKDSTDILVGYRDWHAFDSHWRAGVEADMHLTLSNLDDVSSGDGVNAVLARQVQKAKGVLY